MGKLDHFIEFINRPYFYQDVSYGTKVLKLDSGETMEMPNVMPTVTLLTMNNQYVQLCQVKRCEPFSHTMLFKILDVREASQRKSLQGLDNTTAEGSAAFHTVEIITDSLKKAGLEKKNGACKPKESFRMLNTTSRLVIMFIASQRKPCVPTTATNLPSVTNKIPIFMKSVLISTQKLRVTVKNLKNVDDEVEVQIRGSSWHPYGEDRQFSTTSSRSAQIYFIGKLTSSDQLIKKQQSKIS